MLQILDPGEPKKGSRKKGCRKRDAEKRGAEKKNAGGDFFLAFAGKYSKLTQNYGRGAEKGVPTDFFQYFFFRQPFFGIPFDTTRTSQYPFFGTPSKFRAGGEFLVLRVSIAN